VTVDISVVGGYEMPCVQPIQQSDYENGQENDRNDYNENRPLINRRTFWLYFLRFAFRWLATVFLLFSGMLVVSVG
jgi:hypothetical protein